MLSRQCFRVAGACQACATLVIQGRVSAVTTPKHKPAPPRVARERRAGLPKRKARPRTPQLRSDAAWDAGQLADEARALARRLTEVEIKLCYQEDTVEKLNQMILHQQGQITELAQRFVDVEEHARRGAQEDPDGREGPPPHY